jgi:steroid 5-alpha reductase family enzyme
MPEWGEFWRLMVFALAIPMVMMAGVWVMARVLNNAGIVDIFWSYGEGKTNYGRYRLQHSKPN